MARSSGIPSRDEESVPGKALVFSLPPSLRAAHTLGCGCRARGSSPSGRVVSTYYILQKQPSLGIFRTCHLTSHLTSILYPGSVSLVRYRSHPAFSMLRCRPRAQDFLTGKLAALGIDEDLELSGGEEENVDTAPSTTTEQAAVSTPPPPQPSSPMRTEGSREGREAPPSPRNGGKAASGVQQTSTVDTTKKTPPSAGGGGVEDGEILDMLEKPLQASRGNSGGGGGGRTSGKRGKSRSKNGKQGRGNLTIKECATLVCKSLNEPKYYLMCQVVATIGYNKSKSLLEQVKKIQVRTVSYMLNAGETDTTTAALIIIDDGTTWAMWSITCQLHNCTIFVLVVCSVHFISFF